MKKKEHSRKGDFERKKKKELLLKFVKEKRESRSISKVPAAHGLSKNSNYKVNPPKKTLSTSTAKKNLSRELDSKRRKERKEKLLEFLFHKKKEQEKVLAIQLEKKRQKFLHEQELKQSRLAEKKALKKELVQQRNLQKLQILKKKGKLAEEKKNQVQEKQLQKEEARKQVLLLHAERVKEKEKGKTELLSRPEKKERFLEIINSLKEKQKQISQQKLLTEQSRLAEKKNQVQEEQLQKEEARKQVLLLHAERVKEKEKKKTELLQIIELLKQKNLAGTEIKKRTRQKKKEEKKSLAEVPLALQRTVKGEKIEGKRKIAVQKITEGAIKKRLAHIFQLVKEQENAALQKLRDSQKAYAKLLSILKIRKPVKSVEKKLVKVPGKVPLVVKPLGKPKEKLLSVPSGKYKEPIQLGSFIRRNIYHFIFLLLFIVWLGEIGFFIMRLKPRQEKLAQIVGEEIDEILRKKKKSVIKEKEKKEEIAFKTSKIDIEGKRDPFSTGVLTMAMIKRPGPTQIMIAKKPEIISVMKSPRIISILRKKQPFRKTKVPVMSSILKPERVKTPILSSMKVTTKRLLPIQKVPIPVVSPLVIPEKRCTLVYRGSLIMEGVEYLFLESERKTHRTTVGDIVEGYRILKKDKNVLYLSKEGFIYEINIQ